MMNQEVTIQAFNLETWRLEELKVSTSDEGQRTGGINTAFFI